MFVDQSTDASRSEPGSPVFLEVTGIHKRFGGVHALRGVGFVIERGQIYHLLGENGCGKSTLIKIISGAQPPDEGEIRIEGRAYTALTPIASLSAGIETVYQDLAVAPAMSIAENLFLGRELYRPGRISQFLRVLDKKKMLEESISRMNDLKVGIRSMTQAVETLSGGQRQCVAVARAAAFVADLLAEGLTYNLPDPMSVPFLEWNSQNKVGTAQRSMSPSQRQEAKLPILLPGRVPIYITSDGFPLDIRLLKQSQRVGMPLDTSLIEQCARVVNEGIEDAAINGSSTIDGQDLVVAGYNCPGLLNAPNANTQSLTAADFAVATVNGTNVLAGVTAMVQKLQQQQRARDVMGQTDPLTQQIIREKFDTLHQAQPVLKQLGK